MREGVLLAGNEIILFLDGDIDPYPYYTIPLLTAPIIRGEADFTKAAFDRNAGRVTELVAKPLLSIFFPELMHFQQPLSGMIAGKKSVFSQIDFRGDYGVDIGILIDMHLMGQRVKEVQIGYIENKSRPWQALGKMSKEVASAILIKAANTKNPNFNFEEFGVMHEIRSQMEAALSHNLNELQKMVVFDMDDTLLQGRFVDTAAKEFGFIDALMDIRQGETDPVLTTKRIAKLFKGRNIGELISVTNKIPVVEDAAEVIKSLKQRGYLVGIISDSYDCIANHVKNTLKMKVSLANELEFSKGVCTGEVKIPSFFINSEESICKHAVCKTNALINLLKKYDMNIKNTIAAGDSLNDLCIIRQAGLGIAFCTNNELLNHYADIIINEKSFARLLEIAR
jgi:phosphoserine phosphatase SerB